MLVDAPSKNNEFHELQLKLSLQNREIIRLKTKLAEARKNNSDCTLLSQNKALEPQELNEISLLMHELNQPLTAVIAYSYSCINLIKRNTAQEKLIDILEELIEQSERTGAILQKIKNIL